MAATWDATNLPIRPGLYINFKEAAIAAITGGPRGIVAMPIFDFDENAEAEKGKFYTIERQSEAEDLLGEDYIEDVKLALQGGAKEVLVYIVPDDGEETQSLSKTLEDFETRKFNIFVYPGLEDSADQETIKDWVKDNREDYGKHFFAVFGGSDSDDEDPSTGNSRSSTLEDKYVVNLIVGGELLDEQVISSSEYASYIAGLIAGTRINESITYRQVNLVDVNNRLRPTEIKDALQAGSLVLVHDGDKVKVEQGITTTSDKIRAMSARQAVATDIAKTASEHYIGKLDNSEDGRAALMSAIMAYLETLENNNVLADPAVEIDPDNPPEGDKVFLLISYTEIDSMERIFLTIEV